ncbi:hypothetical protein HanHA300_Chr04g0156711 [Helianthus annuus]|nr:hypothetical protein HanHA300_Chr04g0156711 [Helianthus annuus]KAJ0598851.1 hypothetical protein HanHA89_Chr04g0170241 [Helianthus annuus]
MYIYTHKICTRYPLMHKIWFHIFPLNLKNIRVNYFLSPCVLVSTGCGFVRNHEDIIVRLKS